MNINDPATGIYIEFRDQIVAKTSHRDSPNAITTVTIKEASFSQIINLTLPQFQRIMAVGEFWLHPKY